MSQLFAMPDVMMMERRGERKRRRTVSRVDSHPLSGYSRVAHEESLAAGPSRGVSGASASFGRRRRRDRVHPKLFRAIRSVVGLGREKKFFDASFTMTSDTTPTFGSTRLTSIGQGALDTERIGDKAHLKSLQIRFYLSPSDHVDVSPVGGLHFRVIVYQWFPNDASDAPSASEVLQTVSTSPLALVSPFNHDIGASQFRIMADKHYDLNFAPAGSESSIARPVPVVYDEIMTSEFPRRNVDFIAAGTNGANHIYMLLVSDAAAAGGTGNLVGYSRVTFTDS